MNVAWGAVGVWLLAIASGCGDPDAAVPLDALPAVWTCTDDLDEIVDLLRIGLPLYDYEPATDLSELARRADVVVAGPVDSFRRSEDGETIIVESSDLLHVGPNDAAAPAKRFDIEGSWAERDQPDPLASTVMVEGVEAIAFVYSRGDGSGRFVAGPQGLHVGCSGSDDAATSVIDPVPSDVRGRSVSDLVTASREFFDTAGQPAVRG